jgi:acyl carrier protein
MSGHWLFFDVLNATITMSLKLKKEFGISFNLEDLIHNNFVVALELSLVAFIIRR